MAKRLMEVPEDMRKEEDTLEVGTESTGVEGVAHILHMVAPAQMDLELSKGRTWWEGC